MDFHIVHINETDSTNRWLASQASSIQEGSRTVRETVHAEGLPPCEVVVAAYQTAGKGCGTNSWESERGKNLTFSMLIHPEDIPASEQFHITEIVSVAMCETLQQVLGPAHHVTIKWPNDIYVGEKKICGILIENRLQGNIIKDSIIGIGLNVNQKEFRSNAPNPVSIYQLTGQETDTKELLSTFLKAFDHAYQNKTTCFTYRERLFRKGEDGLYKTQTTCFTARLTDVLSDGRLLLVDQQGEKRLFSFKEVQFIL